MSSKISQINTSVSYISKVLTETPTEELVELEEMLLDLKFDEFNETHWQEVVSPSSSLSSIRSSDDDDSFFLQDSPPFHSKEALSESRAHEDEAHPEETVSLEVINAQIGVAEELRGDLPSKKTEVRAKSTLETIFEGKFLHTPPKEREKSRKSRFPMKRRDLN